MDVVFLQHNQISASLVEDYYHFIQHPKNNLLKPYQVTELARSAVMESNLYKCLVRKVVF